MKKTNKLLISLFILLLFLSTSEIYAEDQKTSIVTIQASYNQTEARNMLDQINALRTGGSWVWDETSTEKIEVKPMKALEYDYGLETYAMQRAAEIALNYAHYRPDGQSTFSGYDFNGENIAIGTGAFDAYTAWLEENKAYKDQGHRRNMLTDWFSTIGIGYAKVGRYYCWVQVFGTSNSGEAETEALVSDKNVDIEILESSMKDITISNPSPITLRSGDTTSIESLSISFRTNTSYKNTVFSASAIPEWTDTNQIVEVEGNTITTLKEGKTTLTAKVLGQQVSQTVEVLPSYGRLGDIDDNDTVNSSDALLALRHSVREITLTGDAFTRGNVTKTDNQINSSDALQILRFSVKEIQEF